MKFHILFSLLFMASFTANAQNFFVYQGTEVTKSDPRYNGTAKFVVRVFLYKEPSQSSTTVYLPRFTYDFSYDSSKISNPEYFVMSDSSCILPYSSSYSLSQGIYTVTPGADVNDTTTSLDDDSNVIHHNVAITSSNNCVSGMIGAAFNGTLYSYEILRVYFDIVAPNPPALSSLVYKDPGATNYVADLGPGGSIAPPGIDPPAPLSPPWLIWPYTNITDASPSWQKCNNTGTGNPTIWNSTDIGGMVLGFGVPLPIRLTNIEALKAGREVMLKWQTASEENNSHFVVERSMDKNIWVEIGKVDGSGNSASPVDYQYFDKTPVYGINYYRIKQVDYNGGHSYSLIKTVAFSTEHNEILIYPNPAKGSVYVTGVDSGNIIITDMMCNVLLTDRIVTNARFNIEALPAGMYNIYVKNEEGIIITRQKLLIE